MFYFQHIQVRLAWRTQLCRYKKWWFWIQCCELFSGDTHREGKRAHLFFLLKLSKSFMWKIHNVKNGIQLQERGQEIYLTWVLKNLLIMQFSSGEHETRCLSRSCTILTFVLKLIFYLLHWETFYQTYFTIVARMNSYHDDKDRYC